MSAFRSNPMDEQKFLLLEFNHSCEPKDVGIGFMKFSQWAGSDNALKYLIQYYTHLLNRSYEITSADVNDIQQNNLLELIERICNSRPRSNNLTLKNLTQASEFLGPLIEGSLDIQHENLVQSSVRFLHTFAINLKPEQDFKLATCCLLLVYHLEPCISKLPTTKYGFLDHFQLNSSSQLYESAKESIVITMHTITKGMKNTKVGKEVIYGFCQLMEKFHKILLISNAWNFGPLYRDCVLAGANNPEILMRVVASIRSVFNSKGVSHAIAFLLKKTNETSIMNLLEEHLIESSSPNLSIELIRMFIDFKVLKPSTEIIEPSKRLHIYASKLGSENQSVLESISQMIAAFENNYDLAFFKALNLMKASNETMRQICENYSETLNLMDTASVIEDFIGTNEAVAVRAALIFDKICQKSHIVLDVDKDFFRVKNLLRISLKDEAIFGCVLSYLMNTQEVATSFLLLRHDAEKKDLINILLKAFTNFQSVFVIWKISAVLKVLKENCEIKLLKTLDKTFGTLYAELLQAEVNVIIESAGPTKLHTSSLIKINAMIAIELVQITSIQVETLMSITSRYCSDYEHPAFPFFLNLQTSVLGVLWKETLGNMNGGGNVPSIINLKFITNCVQTSVNASLENLSRNDFSVLEASIFVSSLLRLLTCYSLSPLTITIEGVEKLLYVNQPELTSAQLQNIVNIIDKFVFSFDNLYQSKLDEISNVEYQSNMLTRLAEFVRCFKFLPNPSQLNIIIRHYREGTKFQAELETLLEVLFKPNTIFVSVVALTIIDLLKTEVNLCSFLNALDQWFAQTKTEKSILKIKSSICEKLIAQQVKIPEILKISFFMPQAILMKQLKSKIGVIFQSNNLKLNSASLTITFSCVKQLTD